MDKVFFKITIPNYNGMAYVRQCLDSIFGQTFQDFFVVFVDDQSTDLSYEFAKMYERKHPGKMKVLRPSEKKMAGGCRNAGIDYPVDCEYLYFMDSDDYLYSRNSLKAMRDAVAENMPDVALFDWCFDKDGQVLPFKCQDFQTYDRENRLASLPWNAAWSRLTRQGVTEKFLENCMRGEDTCQMLKILDKGPSIAQFHFPVYVYRQHQGSAVNSKAFREYNPVLKAELRRIRKSCRNAGVRASIDRRLGL